MSKAISQTDARRYKRRVEELEAVLDAQRASWTHEYPGGVHIATETGVSTDTATSIKTARKLGHAVVAVQRMSGEVIFYALPLPKGD